MKRLYIGLGLAFTLLSLLVSTKVNLNPDTFSTSSSIQKHGSQVSIYIPVHDLSGIVTDTFSELGEREVAFFEELVQSGKYLSELASSTMDNTDNHLAAITRMPHSTTGNNNRVKHDEINLLAQIRDTLRIFYYDAQGFNHDMQIPEKFAQASNFISANLNAISEVAIFGQSPVASTPDPIQLSDAQPAEAVLGLSTELGQDFETESTFASEESSLPINWLAQTSITRVNQKAIEEALWEAIEQQQKQINELQRQIADLRLAQQYTAQTFSRQ